MLRRSGNRPVSSGDELVVVSTGLFICLDRRDIGKEIEWMVCGNRGPVCIRMLALLSSVESKVDPFNGMLVYLE